MAMQNVLKLFRGFRRNDAPDEATASPPSGHSNLRMPELALAPDVAYVAAKGESAHKGDVLRAQAEREVEEHHESLATAFLERVSDEPKGWQQSKTKELEHVRRDLVRVDDELKKISKRIETDVASEKPRSLAERAKLLVTGVAVSGFSIWSIYAMHSFLEGVGILSGWPAWGVSLGPVLFAFAAKEALTVIDGDRQKRIAKLSYIAITIIGAIVWTATFGHEAGSPVSQLNDVNATSVPESTTNSSYFIVRGVTQMVIELFGGGLLFHVFFALWEKKADGQVVTKMVQESPQFLAAEEERRILRERENELENHLAQIAKWFNSHPSFRAQYVTRAKGQFTHVINVLQGA